MGSRAHVNAPAVIEPPQLLEFFALLEGGGAELHQGFQRRAGEPVQPHVLQPRSVAVRKGTAAEHQGPALHVAHDFDAVRRMNLRVGRHGLGERDHRGVGLAQQVGELPDLVGMHKRLVTLDVQDRVKRVSLRFEELDGLVAPNGAVGAIFGGHDHVASEVPDDSCDALVVRGDDHLVAGFGLFYAREHTLNHGQAGDGGEGFAGKARRGVTRGNDRQKVHVRSVGCRCGLVNFVRVDHIHKPRRFNGQRPDAVLRVGHVAHDHRKFMCVGKGVSCSEIPNPRQRRVVFQPT